MMIEWRPFLRWWPWGYGLTILALSWTLTGWLWVGNVGSYPQDEGIYYLTARGLAANGLSTYTPPSDYLTAEYLNPVHLIYVRHLYNSINGVFYRLVGDTQLGMSLLSVLTYPLPCIVLLLLGRRQITWRFVSFFSLCYLSFPAVLVNASRILPDGAMMACLSTAYVLVSLRERDPKRERWLVFFSGAACAFAYLLKEGALLMVFPLLLYFLLFRTRLLWIFVLGLLLAPLVDMLQFFVMTGNPFTRNIIIRKAHLYKHLVEYSDIREINILPFLRYLIPPNYDFVYHTRYFFRAGTNAIGESYVGYAFYGLCLALGYLAVRRSRDPELRLAPAFLGLVIGYGLLEFGFTDITWDKTRGSLVYLSIFKEGDSAKLSMFLSFPVAWIMAFFLHALVQRGRAYAGIAGVLSVALFCSGLASASAAKAILQDGVAELREASRFVKRRLSRQEFRLFADQAALDFLNYFTNEKYTDRLRRLPELMEYQPDGNQIYLLRGGARGIDICYNEDPALIDIGSELNARGTRRIPVLVTGERDKTHYRQEPLVLELLLFPGPERDAQSSRNELLKHQ